MIEPKLKTEIRRLYFAEHWKIGTIAAELSIHHDTVRRAINIDRFVRRGVVRPSQLDPYKDFIQQTLEQYPRLRATRVHEMVKARGYPGTVVQVRRYVRQVRPASRAEAFLALETLPGEQGQVDWGSFGRIQIGHASRSLSCFVMVLSWSRAMYARFTLDQRMESFLQSHVQAFEALGGVPRTLLYDNLKSVVLERHGEHVRYHDRLLELAGHYHFAPKPCAPYRANEKGKVERAIRYLRHSFFAARPFHSLDDLNAQLWTWIAEVAHQRVAPGHPDRRAVATVFRDEQEKLLPLPEHPFETSLVKPLRSGKRPYLRFDLNDYSIPVAYVRKPLVLVASETEVRVSTPEGEIVAHHPRTYDRGQRIEEPAHLAALVAEKKRARELRGRAKLTDACPRAGEVLEALALRGEPLRPATARLNRLLNRYGREAFADAVGEALERGSPHPSSIEHLLEQARRTQGMPPPVEVELPDDPRVRNVTVRHHSLRDYDGLGRDDEEEDDDDDLG
ncbi:MAG: IS21 family transposase [Myxococcota bacterium]